MELWDANDFEERYLADKIDPIDSNYMLSELCAVITNKINHAIAVMTKTKLTEGELSDGRQFMPRFARDEEEMTPISSDSIRKHKAAAAAAYGGR